MHGKAGERRNWMHYLLYMIGLAAVAIGVGYGMYTSNIMFLSNGLLVGVLFGAIGKGVHLLDQIESHLRLGEITTRMREERRDTQERYSQAGDRRQRPRAPAPPAGATRGVAPPQRRG